MNSKIISPMGRGSGAYVIHRILERQIPGYRVIPYHANWTLVPFALRLAVRFRAADLIHTVPDYAAFFYRKSTPMIITFHNYILDNPMRVYSSFFQKLHYTIDLKIWTKLAVNKAKKITAVSNYIANLVKKDMKLSVPIQIIYNGVDVNHFRPKTVKETLQKEIRIFFSGNLTRRKGSQWLPEIANNLQKNIKIYYTQGLRGRGSLPPLENLRPVGPVPYDNMQNCYRQMDILLMPTVREGFGLSVAEAMACGLPVVASDCSAIPELVENGKGGFLCPVGNPKAFAEKINLLADSAQLRKEMGEYNRMKIEKHFTIDRMIREYSRLFKEVCQ
jgi:glycosyltransferase involved in cell wall biosynthesis